jgi:hypothetical protein
MRVNKWSLAMMFAAVAMVPNAMQAQVSCDASGVGNNCALNQDASATIGQVLHLTLSDNTAIDLRGTALTDQALYDATVAAGGPAAYPDATGAPTVSVVANRKFSVTLATTEDHFAFTANGNGCRPSGDNDPAACGGSPDVATAKPVSDVYFHTTNVTAGSTPSALGWTPLSKAGTTIGAFSAGGKWSADLAFKSKWLYATDLPGTYTATMVYTVTGN